MKKTTKANIAIACAFLLALSALLHSMSENTRKDREIRKLTLELAESVAPTDTLENER